MARVTLENLVQLGQEIDWAEGWMPLDLYEATLELGYDPDLAYEHWLETRYSDEMAYEDELERQYIEDAEEAGAIRSAERRGLW